MILEHECNESYGSVMDALATSRPKTSSNSSSSEQEEKKDEQDFENNNNDTASAPSTPRMGRRQKVHSASVNHNSPAPPTTPFFIMDWLKEVNPEDLELARKLLQTPNNNKNKHKHHNDNQQQQQHHHASTGALDFCSKHEDDDEDHDDAVKKHLFATNPRRASTGQLHRPTTPPSSPSPSLSLSTFHRRSIMIGNGWNAKGLQKAQLGRWQDALACWGNALEIRRQVLGEEHVDVANTHNNIGIALGKLNRFEEAISSLHMALEIRTMMMHDSSSSSSSGQDQQQQQHHVQQVAATLHNLANVHQQAGDLRMAIRYLEESIDLLLKQCHPAAPCLDDDDDDEEQHENTAAASGGGVHVARAYVAIGHVYYEAQDLDKAQQSYQQGLEIFLQQQQRCQQSSYEAEMESIRADLDEIKELLRYYSKEEDEGDEQDAQEEDHDEEKENDEQEEEEETDI